MSYRCYVDSRLLAEFDEPGRAKRFVDLVSRYRLGNFEIRDDVESTEWNEPTTEPGFEISCDGITDWRSAFESPWGNAVR